MATKNITEVDAVSTLETTDSLLVNAGGGVKQITLPNAINNLGIVSMELLWENASPNSTFAGQTIKMDLSDYPLIMVLASESNTTAVKGYTIVIGRKGVQDNRIFLHYNDRQIRQYTFTDDSIIFKDALNAGNAATTSGTSTTVAIPLEIYGIKGIQ